jgi:tetratricopeptide (TPR) repeat protein
MNSKGGNLDRARELSERGLRLARDADSAYQEIEFLLQFGTIAALQSPEKADTYVKPAVELARRNGIENLATRGLLGLGSTLHMRGRLPEAKSMFTEAVDYAARSHATALEKRARLSLASVQADMGETDAAAATIADILPYFENAGFRSEASRARILMERIDIARGHYAEALASAQRLLEAAGRDNDIDGQAYAQSDIAEAMLDLDRYPEALAPAQAAYQVREKQRSAVHMGYVLQIAADAQARLGRFQDAAQTIQRAAAGAGDNRGLRALLQLEEARLRQFQGEWARAGSAARAAAAGASGDAGIAGQAKALLALSAARSGGRRDAVRGCTEAAGAIPSDFRARQLALLDCAEAELVTGESQLAAEHARALLPDLERNGQYALLWRALAIAAGGDKSPQAASSANAAWEKLRGRFAAADFQSFAARADTRLLSRWLTALN